MASSPRTVSPQELQESGILQEVNRQFFHPRGMALFIIQDIDHPETSTLGGVLDQRDDPEGILFDWDNFPDARAKASEVERMMAVRLNLRYRLGCDLYGVQPLPGQKPVLGTLRCLDVTCVQYALPLSNYCEAHQPQPSDTP